MTYEVTKNKKAFIFLRPSKSILINYVHNCSHVNRQASGLPVGITFLVLLQKTYTVYKKINSAFERSLEKGLQRQQ
jgi:hypothetical protein